MEKFENQKDQKTPEQKAFSLYDILPEAMQTGRFGLARPRGEYLDSKNEAGEIPAPYILVTFKSGDVLQLHPQNTQNAEEEFSRVREAGIVEPNIATVELVWRKLD